jgi:predicted dinucleotide-binding enzyme
MKIGVLGSGEVAKTLAAGFLKKGHEVMMGSREPAKLRVWQDGHPAAKTGGFDEAARFGEIVVLAVKGTAASKALRAAGPQHLPGKIVVDVTNPIRDDRPPVHGVLPFFTTLDESLMERLQKEIPEARFVKAFNSVGSALMVDPKLKGGAPSMFICGNDEGAKTTVTRLVQQFGWEAVDMGKAEAARAIEPLCMLWCIPGFLRNDWTHAFKLLRTE